MLEKIYQDLDPEARVKALANTAIKRESITYQHEFTEEELNDKRKELAEIVTELVDMEEEKKSYMEGLNAKKKDKEVARNELVNQLKKGGESRFDGCWKFADYDNRTVGYYDANGILVSERPMTPDEYQREMQFNEEETNAQPAGELPPASESKADDRDVEDVDFEEVNENKENNEDPEE